MKNQVMVADCFLFGQNKKEVQNGTWKYRNVAINLMAIRVVMFVLKGKISCFN
jgi:hypothetical protein